MKKLFPMIVILFLLAVFYHSGEAQVVLGGVALFFLGMTLLEEGMKSFAGGTLEKVLKKTTDTTFKAIFTGFTTTALVQSSSLVSLIAISFLSAELIPLAAGIGIVFGANIGTTATAWLVSLFGLKLKISGYALAMAAIGMVFGFMKSKGARGVGNILVGLALLLLAIGFMKEGFDSVKETIDLSVFAIPGLLGLLVFTLVGIFATVVMQSSSATMALVLTALASEQVTYENALALAIGANVGTTVTAVLGALASNASGKRLAVAHLAFNLVTGAIALVLIREFEWAVEISAEALGFSDPAMKLSLFHTYFNLVGVLVMTPLIGPLVRRLEKMFVSREETAGKPVYITEALAKEPLPALTAIRSEINHLYDNALLVLAHGLNLHREDIRSEKPMEEIVEVTREKMEMDIDTLYKKNVKGLYDTIIQFTTTAQEVMTAPAQIDHIFSLKVATRDIVEAIKDMKDLEANIDRYSLSSNPHIRREYNLIREKLGTMLRRVERIRENPKDETLLTKFALAKRELEESDALINGTVDDLIRSNKITASMGTSLMNDSRYAYDIGLKVIQAIEILFIRESEELTKLYLELVCKLDEGVIDDVNKV